MVSLPVLALNRNMHDPFFLDLLCSYPDPEAARAGRRPRLERLLRTHRIRAISATDLAKRLRASALQTSAYVTDASRDEALDLVDPIELLNKQIEAADTRLDEPLERHPNREILRSLPGLGIRLSVRAVAELGDRRERYAGRSTTQSFAGTAPVTRRSGKRGVRSITMRKGCNRTLQAALFTMARCRLATHGRWARAYYDYARGLRASPREGPRRGCPLLVQQGGQDPRSGARHPAALRRSPARGTARGARCPLGEGPPRIGGGTRTLTNLQKSPPARRAAAVSPRRAPPSACRATPRGSVVGRPGPRRLPAPGSGAPGVS